MKMGMAHTQRKLLCPECFFKYKNESRVTPYGSYNPKDADSLDPEMQELKKYLEEKGKM
jgi:hypothetical protein